MKVKIAYPPNYKKIKQLLNPPDNVIFTYGDTIYNPGNGPISYDLLVHETTHSHQQGDNPRQWWQKYLDDPKFRLTQELPAYQNQYEAYCKRFKDRNNQARFLHKIAQDLAGTMYGNIISYEEAVERIRNEATILVNDKEIPIAAYRKGTN